ncbi:hypothetical protein EVJ32_05085 [Exiguobacterium sp. SH5S4]|uniref:hypothetical protein n=1 Tax=Exiguobacterium sp. SH5S4 TaxID=2510961 RepID=UPI00103B801C|nr:hypothetical protein [Exiguobacterium sp. SH5S4]TCI26752.1 hypothetical protein EVJ32_05085 [Exiguobacterium sp. SH5S4]
MKKLNSNFDKNKVLDKKSSILTEEDMARRNKDRGKIVKVYERDYKILKMLSYYSGTPVNDLMKEIADDFPLNVESGDYTPPLIPIRVKKIDWKVKSLLIPTALYGEIKDYSATTKTPFIYVFSDYIEYHYRRSRYYTNKDANTPRYFQKMEGKVDKIIADREEAKRRRW